jgi:glycosyltransferase involved in cell wall biosynthesis
MKIKVLQTIRQGQIGGGERHVLDLVKGMDKSIYEPVVLSFTDGQMIQELKESGIEVHVIYTEKAFDRSVWPKVTEFAKDKGFHIIHAHGTRACSNSYKTARDLNLPLLYTVHGWSFHPGQNPIVRNLRKFFEGRLISKTAATLFVSNENQATGIKEFKPKKARVVKNGVDLSRFRLDVVSEVRSELNIPADIFLIGYICRITLQKDPFTLIEAMAIAAKANPSLHLLMVGDGDLKQEALSKIAALKISDRITFTSFRTDIPQVLKALDVYCLPSLWEGLPIGVLEAMAMSLPAIATPVGGTSELITQGENGYLIPEKNPQKLAERILELSTNKPLCEKMGKRSRQIIENEFSIANCVAGVTAVYQEVLKA